MNRALPGTIIDVIRDGVRPVDLKRRGDIAIYNALVKTAASAAQRGWPQSEWQAEVTRPVSRLGAQAKIKNGKDRPRHQVFLNKAWAAAQKWLQTADAPLDAEQIRQRADEVTAAVLEFAADPEAPLPDTHRAVLAYAATFARQQGTVRPALSRNRVATACGLKERAARNALAELERDGLLLLEVRGRASGDPEMRRANLYRLPDAAALATYTQYRGTRSVGSPAQVYGQAPPPVLGQQAQVYGQQLEPEDSRVITIEGPPEAIAAFIDELARRGDVRVSEQASTERAGNVVPLRPATDRRSA